MTDGKKRAEHVLLINDIAGYGKISLGVMIPVMSHMGFNIYNLPTAVVSNTLDYGLFEILDTTEYMKNALEVWKKLGFSFDAICTGLIISDEQAQIIAGYCREQKRRGVRVFVDPIMGDDGKLYNGVADSTVAAMRRICAVADVVMPNYTEAVFLADRFKDRTDISRREAEQLTDALREMGAGSVVITSVTVEGETCVFGYDKEAEEYFRLPFTHIPVFFSGTGDLFSSLLVGGVLKGIGLQRATAHAMKIVSSLIERNKDNADKYKGIPIEKYLEEMTSF